MVPGDRGGALLTHPEGPVVGGPGARPRRWPRHRRDLRLLAGSRADPRRLPLGRGPRPASLRRAGSAPRPRRGGAHRPVGARGGPPRRVPGLAGGPRAADEDGRPGVPGPGASFLQPDDQAARRADARRRRPRGRGADRERALRPARAPGDPATHRRRPRAAPPALDGDRVGWCPAARHPAAGLQRLRGRVLGGVEHRLAGVRGHPLPLQRGPRRPHGRRRPARGLRPDHRRRGGARVRPRDAALRHLRARGRHARGLPPPPARRCAGRRGARPRQDRQRLRVAGVLHVRRRHATGRPARDRAGVAGDRLPQRRPHALLRLLRTRRRARADQAAPPPAAPTAPLAG